MNHETILALANKAFKEGNYQDAVNLYQNFLRENPGFERVIHINLQLAKSKLSTEGQSSLPKNPTNKKRIVVYTCNFGSFETVKEPEIVDPDVEYILFTDQTDLTSKYWKVIVLNERISNPRRASRLPKLLPHRYLPDHDVSIYIDSSLTIRATNLLNISLDTLQGADIAAYPHFMRKCTYEELSECVKLEKALAAKTDAWKIHLESEGFPKNYGLLENAFLIRRNTESMRKLNEAWYQLYSQGEERDQFYLMYLLWKQKLPFTIIKNSKDFRKSPYIKFTSHTEKSILTKSSELKIAKRVAVALHIYYEDMWPMLAGYLKNIKGKADIFVSCRQDIYESLSHEVNKNFPEAEVIAVENLGMDVYPFLYVCKERQLYRYDAVLKLHTKNQKTVDRAHQGRIMLNGLCGSEELVNNILQSFDKDSRIGMVGAAFQVRSANALMYGNRTIVSEILNDIDIQLDDWPFFCGTMFWISGRLLISLVSKLGELTEKFRRDAIVGTGADGTTAHALERIFGALPAANGARVYVTEKADTASDHYLIMPIELHGPCCNPRYIESGSTWLINRLTQSDHSCKVVKKHGNFQTDYYLEQVGADFVPGMDPIYHFVLYGDLLGNSPNPEFNVNYYQINKPDVERKGICSVVHYIQHGKTEGAICNPEDRDWLDLAEKRGLFDAEWYRNQYSDDLLTRIDPKQHYQMVGYMRDYATGPNFKPSDIPVIKVKNSLVNKGCISFLSNYYRDEAHIYEVLIRAASNGDHYLVSSFLHKLKTTYGETRATMESAGSYFILTKKWQKASEIWGKYWADYNRGNFVERHRKSIAFFDRPVPSDNGKFPLSILLSGNQLPKIISVKICIYTTLFGGIDDLLPIINPVQGVDYICFTDRVRDAKGWKQIVVNPGMLNDNLNAKIYKVLPHKFLGKYEYSLFVDANTLFLGKVEQLLRLCLGNGDFVMWQHPFRDDVYLEGCAIVGFLRHEPTKIIDQLKHYSDKGLPHSTGLLEASFIWRRHGQSKIKKLMEDWWIEINSHSARDQLSLGYLMWRDGPKPKTLPHTIGNSRSNDYFFKVSHKNGKSSDKNRASPKLLNRDITFLYSERYREAGSTVMRGEQLSSLVRTHYQGKRNVHYTDRTDIKNNIIILTKGFLKENSPDVIARLTKSNFVIADFVDEPPTKDLVEVVDALMASSLCGYRDYLKEFQEKPAFHVTHHIDTRLSKTMRIPQKKFCAAYFGELVNTIMNDSIANFVDFNKVDTSSKSNDWLDNLNNFNFHYAVRKTRKIDGAKPFLKGFVAAHCGANMMIQKSAGDARYYLGYDYPYLLSDDADIAQIISALEEAKDSFGTATWRYGLEIMQEVKQRSSNQHVLLEFEQMLQAI